MDRTAIGTRVQQLSEMKVEQQRLLAGAQQAVVQHQANLALIEGGLQDCQFWLEQVRIAEEAKAQVESNGVVAEPATDPSTN